MALKSDGRKGGGIMEIWRFAAGEGVMGKEKEL
jgi:hypothetical protein